MSNLLNAVHSVNDSDYSAVINWAGNLNVSDDARLLAAVFAIAARAYGEGGAVVNLADTDSLAGAMGWTGSRAKRAIREVQTLDVLARIQ